MFHGHADLEAVPRQQYRKTGQHHTSMRSLRDCAQRHCRLCAAILADILVHDEDPEVATSRAAEDDEDTYTIVYEVSAEDQAIELDMKRGDRAPSLDGLLARLWFGVCGTAFHTSWLCRKVEKPDII